MSMANSWNNFDKIGNIRRRISIFTRLTTKKRVVNYLKNNLEYRNRTIELASIPIRITIDPSNICNLQCPLCATGAGILDQKKGFMQYEMFTKIYNQVEKEIVLVNLFNWGEPLLNPEVFKIIDEIYKSGAISNIHSNFCIKKSNVVKKLAQSKLTFLVLSIDGATNSSYETYRKGGNFKFVLRNVTKLVKKRRELEKQLPEIIWKFIVHKHNEHEIDDAKRLAAVSGVDRIKFTPILADLQPIFSTRTRQERWTEDWLPVYRTDFRFDSMKKPLYETACYFLWQEPVINVDGTVSPCCFIHDSKNIFGDLNKNSFKEIWNNDLFKYSRSLFSKQDCKSPPTIRSICDSCTLFRRRKQ
jgi:radical SAM protein with 4Fe4S-binding SPASM domain